MIGWLYAQIGNFRNSLFEKGFLKTYPLGAPTISVGNITMGGTGKTPLVAYIADLLSKNGKKVCILSRGYGRESTGRILVADGEKVLSNAHEAGDEPFELAQKLAGKAIVIADADRVSAAAWAHEKFDIDVFVLDDAFQHRRARRDLDIVCVDAMKHFGSGLSNMLRESPENLDRANAIVITRANLADNIEELKACLRQYNQRCPVFTVSNRSSEFREISSDKIVNREDIIAQKAFAFCALGNPENFFEQLRREGFNVVGTKAFRDHHRYGWEDLLSICSSEERPEIYLTTFKDANKLKETSTNPKVIAVRSELLFDDEKAFRGLIYSFLSGGPFLSPQ